MRRVAELQESVWSCEERIQYLETTNAAMADDIVHKSALIEHYSMRGFDRNGHAEQVWLGECRGGRVRRGGTIGFRGHGGGG